MYTLLIADDERIERDALRYIITRATTSVDRIIEAVNGTEAIAIAERERPDIVFLDIKMPGTNGIDAARAIKATLPDAQLVFLTAFDYFDYAHEAIRIGVSDFVVKPATDERVMEVIARASTALDARLARREQHPDVERRRHQMIELLERELIGDLLRGDLDREQLASYLSIFDIEALSGYPVCVALDYDSYPMAVESDTQRSVLKRRALAALRSTIRETGIAVFGSDQHSTLQLLLCCDERDHGEIRERLETAAGAVWRALSIRIRIGVGAFADVPPRFTEGFAQAAGAVPSGEAVQADDPMPVVAWYRPRESITDLLPPASDEDPPGTDGRGGDLARGAVTRVQQYIRTNFSAELSLEQAARMVRLSPFYFSKVFKLHAGTNFVDFMNRIRIDRACVLLREDRFSIKEIASQVGYTDANYFARMFKRHIGDTPSSYRRRVRR